MSTNLAEVYLHPQEVSWTRCRYTVYLCVMPNQPKTPTRPVRVDDELWSDYGQACEADDVTRSDDLRSHMRRRVRRWKRLATAAPDATEA
jgi:hypothetical protein